MIDPLYDRLVFLLLLAVIVTQATFAAFPDIDIAVSGLFADGSAGFPWAASMPATINLGLRRVGELLAFGIVSWCILGGVAGLLRGDTLLAWVFAALSLVLASGIVNLVLKAHVGRARPVNITEFGGGANFTPAWQVADQCARNCSFTSGEVALASSLATVILVLLWPRLQTRRARLQATAAAATYVGLVILLRIGLGRHFLSDAIFSTLLSGGIVLILYPILRISRVRLAFEPRLPVQIFFRGLDVIRARARALVKRET